MLRPARVLSSALSVWLVVLAAPAASADKVVWFDFSAGGFTQEEQNDIMQRVHAKYEFEWFDTNVGENLRFVKDNPGGNVQRVVFDNTQTGGPWGRTRRATATATVNARAVTHGNFRNQFANREQQINSIVDTAAHELAHLKGLDHNCHAPANQRTVRGKDGRDYVAEAGDGTLVGGRPGVMVDGTKLTPGEKAAGGRDFTVLEQRQVAAFIRREKAGRPVHPTPDTRQPESNICFIRGVYFDPTAPDSQPEWTEPFPLPDEDDWVSLMATFANNSAWDFGFETSDGGFMPLVEAGVSADMIGFEPGTIVNFAIRPLGAGFDDPGLSVVDVGWIDSWSETVPAPRAVEPTTSADYFGRARIVFDPDDDPGTPNVEVALFSDPHSPHFFDGIYPIPEPATAAFLLLGGCVLRRRNS
ncbi:MAG: hypothetical protein AB7Q17_02060 [Phycisphaerae bacterium]